jgi:hypothetical protein
MRIIEANPDEWNDFDYKPPVEVGLHYVQNDIGLDGYENVFNI